MLNKLHRRAEYSSDVSVKSTKKSLNVNCTHHDFAVLLFVYVLVTEHVAGTQHYQFASLLQKTLRHPSTSSHKYAFRNVIWSGCECDNYIVPLTFP